MSTQPTTERQGLYVQANGISIYYEEYGAGEPLILLHGGTTTSQMWQPLIPALAEHFRVITPDSRGHGLTNNPADELSYRGMAEDVVAFAHALEISSPLIFGYSDGGQIALELGLRHGDFARGLIVAGAFYKFDEKYFSGLVTFCIERSGNIDFDQLQQKLPQWIERLQMAHPRPEQPTYWQTLLKQIAAMWTTPLDYTAEGFNFIAVPTLILIGDRDEVISLEQAVEMYQMIPKAELAVVPNATHGTALNPITTIPTIVDFLTRHAA